MDKTMLVSIIMPVYNSSNYLAESVRSALNQTWKNIELIIVNDGSTDSSPAILKGLNDPRIKIFEQENKGASAARNFGLRQAKGDFIQFLDADDLLDDNKIESQMRTLEGKKECLAICPCVHFFGADGDFAKYPEMHQNMSYFEEPLTFAKKLFGSIPDIPASMIEIHSWLTPKEVLKKAGWWNESLSVDDDGEYFLRVLLASKGVYNVMSSNVHYRKTKAGQSLSGQWASRRGLLSSIKALDLKYAVLRKQLSRSEAATMFSKFYWEKSFFAFPRQYRAHRYCYKRAVELGYNGPKIVGSQSYKLIGDLFGWKFYRFLQFSKNFR